MHWGEDKEYILTAEKKGYDEVAYDAFIGILGGIASWKYGVGKLYEKYRQILVEKGHKDGEAYTTLDPVKKVPRDYEPNFKAVVVQLPSFDEFIKRHGNSLKAALMQEIMAKSPKRMSEDEEKKIERTIEIAIDAARKLAEAYGDPEKIMYVGMTEIDHAKHALDALEYINPEKDPLEVIGDHIIELKKMHPEVVKPEIVYGDRWYEFLKKKGIDPEVFRGKKKPKAVKSVSPDLEKAKLEVLSVLNGLEFAGFSDDAKAKAIEKLSARIAELSSGGLTPERVFEIGLYAFALEMIKTGTFERLREVEKL